MPLGEVAISIASGRNKERTSDGKYPVYGSTGIISTTDTPVYSHEQILVARVGSAGYVHIASGEYDVSDNTLIIDVKEEYSLKYLYYMLVNMNLNQYAKGGGQPLITAGELKKLLVPVPSREIQDRLVNVLDNFDSICSDLSIGLPAEINARQKQYEHYRDVILNYAETGKLESVRERELIKLLLYVFGIIGLNLKDIFDIKNGYTPSKKQPEFWDNGTLPWFRMDDIREHGRVLSDSIQHITPKGLKGKLFPKDSIIMATTATIGEHALITVESLANQQFTYFVIKEPLQGILLPKFAFYYFFVLDKWCLNNVNTSAFSSVEMSRLKKQQFPIPSIEKQKRIISILDRFDTLCNDISQGLPAEIEARKKQYEYYRDKLLSN